jgi:hypothetical protein
MAEEQFVDEPLAWSLTAAMRFGLDGPFAGSAQASTPAALPAAAGSSSEASPGVGPELGPPTAGSSLVRAGIVSAPALQAADSPGSRMPAPSGVSLSLAPSSASPGAAASGLNLPRPSHVVIVIEENHSYSEIIGSSLAPYINSLAKQGAVMTQSFAVEHPSQPNYLDLFSGSNQGVTNDQGPHTFAADNLASELIAAGFTFGSYSESMPSVGYTGLSYQNLYVRRHNPAVDFTNVPAQDNMPFAGSFPSDYSQLPTVSLVVPNLLHDMHTSTIQQGDNWLRSNLQSYVAWAKSNSSLLIVTWDEDDKTQGNQIPTLFVGPMVRTGQYSELINHFNVLRTVEDLYGLSYAGASATVTPITDIWHDPPTAPKNLSATPASFSQVNLAWTDPVHNVAGIQIERSTDGTNYTTIASVGATVTTYSDTGLTAWTTYFYRVLAFNAGGDSPYSNVATTRTATPTKPSNLTATATSASEIDLAWSDTTHIATGFELQRSTDDIHFSQVATVAANIKAYSDTGLSAQTTYYYRVRAYNAVGNSAFSNVANATTST